MNNVGSGLAVNPVEAEGVLRVVEELEDVLQLIADPELENTILLTSSPGATVLVPLLTKVRGVVCTGGGRTSHLALVSRELGLACVMSADVDIGAMRVGGWVRLAIDGSVHA